MEEKETNVMKASRFEIEQQLNQYIGNLKVDGLSADAKLALVKLKLELSKVMEDIDAFRKKAVDSIEKPENFDELREAANKEGATAEDKEAYKKAEEEYNKKFTDIALPYFNEIIDIPFDFISIDDFYNLVKNNEVNVVFGYEYIYRKLVKQ